MAWLGFPSKEEYDRQLAAWIKTHSQEPVQLAEVAFLESRGIVGYRQDEELKRLALERRMNSSDRRPEETGRVGSRKDKIREEKGTRQGADRRDAKFEAKRRADIERAAKLRRKKEEALARRTRKVERAALAPPPPGRVARFLNRFKRR